MNASPTIRSLSLHAWYRCHNSGACCSAGWPIPVEPQVLPVLRAAIDAGPLRAVGDGPSLTVAEGVGADTGTILGRTRDGACVFFDRAQEDGCCRVQRVVGLPAMPIACRQFPRIVRHTTRGTDVSLSHWCPTALACLAGDGDVTIVEAPAAFPDAPWLEGLDTRSAWPPLLRPDCLCDPEAYEYLEGATVDVLANTAWPLETRLRLLHALYERLRDWRPIDGPQRAFLTDAVDLWRATCEAKAAAPSDAPIPADLAASLWQNVLDAIPESARGHLPRLRDTISSSDALELLAEPASRRRVGRYLAARAFGAWVAYQGRGLRTTLATLTAALVAVQQGLPGPSAGTPDERISEGIRTADLLLLHLGAPDTLAAALGRYERAPLPISASG